MTPPLGWHCNPLMWQLCKGASVNKNLEQTYENIYPIENIRKWVYQNGYVIIACSHKPSPSG